MGDGSSLGLDPLKESGPFFRQVLKGLQGSEKEIDRPLRIYEHKNGIYSVHGNSDIELVASCNLENLHSVEQIQIRNLQVVPTLRLNYRLVSDLIAAALSSAGRKVELWSRSGGSASIKASGSPARHDELDDFLEHNTRATTNGDSAIVAVKMGTIDGNRVLGVAACQSGGLHLSIGEFNDDEFFSQLESIIVSVGAREVLFCTNDASDYDESKISEVLAKCGAARTKLKKSDFSAEFIEIDMRTLVGASLEAVQFLDAKLGMAALASLIRYLGLLEQSSLEGNVRLNRLDNDSFMKLDAAALAALNVFPKPGETGPSSLYGLLNKTKTSMGARLLRRWMSQPLQDKKLIETRLDLVDAFLLDPTMRTRLRDEHLKRIPDLSSICRKFQKKPISASLQDVVKLYQFSARLPFLRTVISEHEDANCQAKITDRFGKVLQELSSELANFEALVETTIDLDELDNYEFVINPTIDEVLMELKEKKDEILSDISETYEATRDALGMDSEKLKLEKKDGLGYYYRLTRKDEKLIRDRKAFLVIETRKDGVRFTNKDLRRLSSQYYELAEEYNTKQSELKKKTLEVVSTYLPVFEDCVISVAELDVLVSFACAAADAPEMYTRPTILAPGDGLQIDSGRHPMVIRSSRPPDWRQSGFVF
uniref:DNA mismatch repair protein MutS core domain-containing protein n=1 Tax=Rhodosorus marinus TaxID=101924 RepID=A0A7S2ZAK3_9RHOD|mmetsp:Transcript_1231/g.3582  ORF Transcript_1231/g.3582 Transcript_1231/m.3582 type:complete len:653 (+) Transcript_1231:111-2069(+)